MEGLTKDMHGIFDLKTSGKKAREKSKIWKEGKRNLRIMETIPITVKLCHTVTDSWQLRAEGV